MLRGVLIVVGVLMTAMGLLWIGQGLGIVRWPASSCLIDQCPWSTRGALLAVAGLVVILLARRIRR